MSLDVHGTMNDHQIAVAGGALPEALGMTVEGLSVAKAYTTTGRAYFLDATFKSAETVAWQHPVHAFLLVTEGALEIDSGKGWKLVGRGESFIVPKGVGVSLRSNRATLFVSLCRDKAEGSSTEVVHVDLGKVHPTSAPYNPDLLVSGDPVQGSLSWFSCSQKLWNIGTWQSTQYRRIAIPFPKHEFMYFHIGSVELEESETVVHHKDRGQPFLVPKGYTVVWDNRDYVYKTACSEIIPA